jgi:DNA-binding NarL/FixJ family response regulator
MCYRVMFLDDETFFASAYLERLQEHFDVAYFDNARDGLVALHSDTAYHALILDIMMPTTEDTPPNILSVDMGLWLLSELKKKIMDGPLPVLVLTNRDVEHVRTHVAILGFTEGVIEVYRKIDLPAKRLPLVLQNLLHRWHPMHSKARPANGTEPSR